MFEGFFWGMTIKHQSILPFILKEFLLKLSSVQIMLVGLGRTQLVWFELLNNMIIVQDLPAKQHPVQSPAIHIHTHVFRISEIPFYSLWLVTMG